MQIQRWQDWLTTLIGLWLVVSPWTLQFFGETAFLPGSLFWNAVICGLVVTVFGVIALTQKSLWEEWGDIVAGLWLAASPWVLSFADRPVMSWNAWLCGVAIVLLAGWRVMRGQGESRA